MMNILITYFLIIHAINGTGFDYPSTMPEPFEVQSSIFRTNPSILKYETPILIRIQTAVDTLFWNCVAIYHATASDALTRQRPRVVVDSDILNNYATSNTRALCATYAIFIVRKTLVPEDHHLAIQIVKSWGLNEAFIDDVHADVADCDINDVECLQNVAEMNNFIPEIIGSIIAYEMLNFLQNDGWNADGKIGCAANCNPYSDTIGYKPKSYNPSGNTQSSEDDDDHDSDNDNNNQYSWQPLQENDGKGFFYRHDHVTPHIGEKAALYVLSRKQLNNFITANPNYNYNLETQLVIDRLADTAINDTKKMLIEFYDNKLAVAGRVREALEMAVQNADGVFDWTYEEQQLWLNGYTAAEYDATILSWKEKIRWDLVRPTTLIKRKNQQQILTYGGPYQGVKQIPAKDFETYIRVMPHSEYPSASGCICAATTTFTDKLAKDRYEIIEDIPVKVFGFGPPFFAKGSSSIEPGTTPAENLFVTLGSLKEFGMVCGKSRLWGGMHFTASVTEAQVVCKNLGEIAYQYVIDLLNGQPL